MNDKQHVLIVDDEPDIRELLVMTLSRMGLDVTPAADMAKHSRRMNGIVENILQLSRREKSRPELFDLLTWLDELVDEFNSANQGLEFELQLEDEAGELLVMFDRSQLHQALWKLMENAAQRQENGGSGAGEDQ